MSITKLISTGEGGFAVTRDDQTAHKLRRLRNQGVDNVADNVFDGFGFNLRFNDLQAGVGLAQVQRLPEKMAGVRRVYDYYREHLADLPYLTMLTNRVEDGELPLWSEALCAERETVIARLAEQGVQAKAFHPCFAESRHLNCGGDYPNSRFFADHGLILPSGPDQPEENLARTVAALRNIAGEVRTRIRPLLPPTDV
jgi:perosamine synthetase